MKLNPCSARRLAAIGLAMTATAAARLHAQEHPTQRVANIVIVAVEEYGKGVDARGSLIDPAEYQEAIGFLTQARQAAGRLPSNPTSAAVMDSIMSAAQGKRPPEVLKQLAQRFSSALGSEAALQLPHGAVDTAAGAALFAANCASCHGARGEGNGPAAAVLSPKPPALATAGVLAGVSPALAFRMISVGVTGTAMPAFGSKLSDDQRWNLVAYLSTLRQSAATVAEGEGLYDRDCVQCHGALGRGDGPLARTLSKLPPEVGSFNWQAQRSDSQLADVARRGIVGSPMPADAALSVADAARVAAYLRSLALRPAGGAGATVDSARDGVDAAARLSLTMLEQSLTAARDGRQTDAEDHGFDAYVAFEPIEAPVHARDPGLVTNMEKLYGSFRGAIHGSDLRGAQQALDAIGAEMPHVLELTRPAGNGAQAFLQSFLIILREGFEAILVVGAVVAFLRRTGHQERLRSIWTGIVLALVASGITAVVLKTVLAHIPASQDIIEGITLLMAVGVLFSVSYWLISRVEAAKWQQFIREKVNNALEHGGGTTLAFVAFLAVYREGAETALFYQALFSESANVALPITLGIVVGFVALAIIFTLFYRYGVRIPLRPFFGVTSVLLYYMAFVFAGKGIKELQEGAAIPMSVIPGMPTVEALGLYPTWQTVIAQLVLLGLFAFALVRTFWPKRSVALPTIPPVAGSLEIASELQALRQSQAELKARLDAIDGRREDGTTG